MEANRFYAVIDLVHEINLPFILKNKHLNDGFYRFKRTERSAHWSF